MVVDEKTEISLSSANLLLQVTRLQNTKYMYVIGSFVCFYHTHSQIPISILRTSPFNLYI